MERNTGQHKTYQAFRTLILISFISIHISSIIALVPVENIIQERMNNAEVI